MRIYIAPDSIESIMAQDFALVAVWELNVLDWCHAASCSQTLLFSWAWTQIHLYYFWLNSHAQVNLSTKLFSDRMWECYPQLHEHSGWRICFICIGSQSMLIDQSMLCAPTSDEAQVQNGHQWSVCDHFPHRQYQGRPRKHIWIPQDPQRAGQSESEIWESFFLLESRHGPLQFAPRSARWGQDGEREVFVDGNVCIQADWLAGTGGQPSQEQNNVRLHLHRTLQRDPQWVRCSGFCNVVGYIDIQECPSFRRLIWQFIRSQRNATKQNIIFLQNPFPQCKCFSVGVSHRFP